MFQLDILMHKTLHPEVLGFVDSKRYEATVKGWCFYVSREKMPLRVLVDGAVTDLEEVERPDVANHYKADTAFCGWSFNRKTFGYKLQMCIDFEWHTVFEDAYTLVTEAATVLPSFLVVDGFYKDPDSVREFALHQNLVQHPNNHKGIRSDAVYRFPGLKERFEALLGRPIRNWEGYGTNGCFQINMAGEQAVYHADTQIYAGVIFLTPNAPGQAGTQFFHSKDGISRPTPLTHDAVFKGGFLDSTKFEKLDVVGNVYNRLVLFDAHMIHAADTYFGKARDDGRLIQLFFFDI